MNRNRNRYRDRNRNHSRSRSLAVAGAVLLAVALGAGPARAGDPATLYDQVTDPVQRLYFRTTIANPDGTDVVYFWKGNTYLYIPGDIYRPPYPGAPGNYYPHGGGNGGTPLTGFEGYNIRRVLADPQNPNDFILATREVVFYTDPSTGARLETWTNPITGVTTPVVPVINEYLYTRYRVEAGVLKSVVTVHFPTGPGTCGAMEFTAPVGQSPEQWGDDYMWPVEVFPRYKLDDCGRYGITDPMGLKSGRYTSSENFTFLVDKGQLKKVQSGDSAYSGWVPKARLTWARTGPALPWMCMDEGSYPLQVKYSVRSHLLESWSQVPGSFKTMMKTYSFPLGGLDYAGWQTAPQTLQPPPNPAFPNVLPAWDTSWSMFHERVLAPAGQTWQQWCAAQ
jgi:hypothetical protein